MKFPKCLAVLVLILSACGTPQSAAPDAAAAVVLQPTHTPTSIPMQTLVPASISRGVHVTMSLNQSVDGFTFMRLILSSTTKDPLGQVFAYVFVNGAQMNGENHEAWGHPCSDTTAGPLDCEIPVVMFQSFSVSVTSEGQTCQVSLNVPLQVTQSGAFDDATCLFE